MSADAREGRYIASVLTMDPRIEPLLSGYKNRELRQRR